MRAERSMPRRPRGPSLFARMMKALGMVTRVALVLGAVAVIGGALVGTQLVYDKLDVPIGVIGVDGELQHLEPREVEAIVGENLNGGFLSLDLEAICRGLEQHPWVASASARRKWPNQLVIAIEEESPIARWGKSGFLNNKGELLQIDQLQGLDELPLLAGPEGKSRDVMQQYRNFAQMLQPTALHIVGFRLGKRGDWKLHFAEGPTLVVGRGQVSEKLQRFLLVWDKHLGERLADIETIDIRYGNGVAVSWKNNKGKV